MNKMTYQEKIKYAETAYEMIKNGSSRDEINAHFENEGIKSWDIDKINYSLDNLIKQTHKDKIKAYMLSGTLESKLSEFDDIDAKLFEQIQYQIIGEIQEESSKVINSMLSQGEDEKTILNTVVNTHFDRESALATIDAYSEQVDDKKNEILKGVGIIILGIVLTIASFFFATKGGMLFYGLIIYGVVVLVRPFLDKHT